MSKELNILLQRIHPVLKPSEPPEPSENLLRLIGRMENRRWLESELVHTQDRLKEVKADLKFIKHALNCSQCLMELQLDIERYLGRQAPWYLNISDEVGFDDEVWESLPEYYRDCPRVENYKIGSYWRGPSPDTIRFIKDRLKWAQKTLDEEVRVIRRYLRALRKWDLVSPLPPDSYIFSFGVDFEKNQEV